MLNPGKFGYNHVKILKINAYVKQQSLLDYEKTAFDEIPQLMRNEASAFTLCWFREFVSMYWGDEY